MLPAEERAWLDPHRNLLLLGTEAPDNDDIPLACGVPHSGYDDRRRGHSVEWLDDGSNFVPHPNGGLRDRAARFVTKIAKPIASQLNLRITLPL